MFSRMPRRSSRRSYRPSFEMLEDRALPSVTAVSDEFVVRRVLPDTEHTSQHHSVAAAADGRFVETWVDRDPNLIANVYARIYGADGTPLGDAFQVNTAALGFTNAPAIASDKAGDCVIAWIGDNAQGQFGVQAQRLSLATGSFEGSNFQVNPSAAGFVQSPAVAIDDSGTFALVWIDPTQNSSNSKVMARVFAADGTPQTNQFQVNTALEADAPTVAMDGVGDFVVAWHSNGPNPNGLGAGSGVYSRYFVDNAPVGDQVQLNTYTAGGQFFPSAAMDDAGNFVVTWQSDGQDGSGLGVEAYLSYNGLKGTFQVNQFTIGDQYLPQAAMDPQGDFVITWTSIGQNGSGAGVYARSFGPGGQNASNEFPVNQFLGGNQDTSSVAMNSQGDFIVTWEGEGQDGGTEYGVYARRYLSPPQDFSYDAANKVLSITPSGVTSFQFSRQTVLDSADVPHQFDRFQVDQHLPYVLPDSMLASVHVTAQANGANLATLTTSDTYQTIDGVTHETPAVVLVGNGGGAVERTDAAGNGQSFLSVSGFAKVYAFAGPADAGFIYSTPNTKNVFVGAGGYAYMDSGLQAEDVYLIQGANYVYGYALSGLDYAYQYDGSGPSTYVASGTAYNFMSGIDGGRSFVNEAVGFAYSDAIAKHPQQDVAIFYDSPLNDVFIGNTTTSYLFAYNAAGICVEFDNTQNFSTVYAYSFVGGTDYAYVYNAAVNHVTGFHM